MALVCVQPLASHIAREQEDYTRAQADQPDAVLIGRLAARAALLRARSELDESWACLRQLGRAPGAAGHGRDRRRRSGSGPAVGRVAVGGDRRPATRSGSTTWLAALEVVTSRCGGGPGPAGRQTGEEEFLALVRRDAAPGVGHGAAVTGRIARKVRGRLADDPRRRAPRTRRGCCAGSATMLGDLAVAAAAS